jgi:flagellar hook-basal body complex protein FliE
MINSINALESLNSQFKTTLTQTPKDQQSSFSDIFKNLLDNVNKTDETAKRDQFLLATGQADDLHTVAINMAKADVALQVFVQVRNKALDAYNDIMKMAL